jgi:hypothetical protein
MEFHHHKARRREVRYFVIAIVGVKGGSLLALPVKRGASGVVAVVTVAGDDIGVEDPGFGVVGEAPGVYGLGEFGHGGEDDEEELGSAGVAGEGGAIGVIGQDDSSVDAAGDGGGEEGGGGGEADNVDGEVSAAGIDEGVTGMMVIVTMGSPVDVASMSKLPGSRLGDVSDFADWATPSVTVIVIVCRGEGCVPVNTVVAKLWAKGVSI